MEKNHDSNIFFLWRYERRHLWFLRSLYLLLVSCLMIVLDIFFQIEAMYTIFQVNYIFSILRVSRLRDHQLKWILKNYKYVIIKQQCKSFFLRHVFNVASVFCVFFSLFQKFSTGIPSKSATVAQETWRASFKVTTKTSWMVMIPQMRWM